MLSPGFRDSAKIWELHQGHGPIVAVAVHHGHAVRPEVADRLALSPADRRREEDPFTGLWTGVAATRLVGLNSRFEVDLNRPRDKAVYLTPDDAWGLQVWHTPPPADLVERSLGRYDAFYAELRRVLTELIEQHGRLVVLDLHSYNHRRAGPDQPAADPAQNPEVNIGTGTMDRPAWAPLIERFMADLRDFDFRGRRLDVRENVKFFGGQVPRWVHQTFPASVCVLAIEVKKFFMDEWTGQPDESQLGSIRLALQATIPGLLEELQRL
ncbi:MAG TPA: N-formylglutamate amidohydrolase [Anaerolineae bacterium]|nr:N-formylglutamate amidohydrolase [Anaerolineae bacterium]